MEKLKKTRNFFTSIGYARINDLTFNIDKVNNKNTYKFNKANIKLEFENNDCLYFESFGGYSIDEQGKYRSSKLYVNNKNTNEMFNIDFNDRNNEQILDVISPNSFKRAGIHKKEDGKLDVQYFLSEYDLIQYLKDNLTDKQLVKINGVLQYQENNGQVYVKQIIKNLFALDELRSNEKLGCTFNQEIIVTNDSINLNDIEDNELKVNATVVEYCSNIKENKPITKQFVIKLNKDNPKEISAMSLFIKNYIKPPKETVRSINLKCKMVSATENEKLTESDITEDLRSLIDAGFMKLEDVLKSTSSKTTTSNKLYITEPVIIKNAQGKLTIDYDDDKYKDLVFTNINLDDIPFDTGEEKNSQMDIDDLDSLLGNILNN